MSTTKWWEGPPPANKFAQKFKTPIYVAKVGTIDFVNEITDYILKLEKDIIETEELVSKVPKSTVDPYRHTQQWKQHNLFNDVPGLDGDHLQRFPKHSSTGIMFDIIRASYLEHLATLRYPRPKVYIHGWANVLRNGEYISEHSHSSNCESYLSGCYYLTTNSTNLYLRRPASSGDDDANQVAISTEARKMVFFPSWVPHWSDKCTDDKLRISVAFDIVSEVSMKGNPWRPHVLLDDPETMPGLV